LSLFKNSTSQSGIARAATFNFKKINVDVFSNLVLSFFGVALKSAHKEWFAIDGKELRGSILKGNTRGEAVVHIVGHSNRNVYKQGFYNGKKESERPCVRDLLDGTFASKKITLDALHLIPETVNEIEKQKGVFVIGVKENQAELLEEMLWISRNNEPFVENETCEKSHGRIDKRFYKAFDVRNAYFDQRWYNAGFKALIKVDRDSYNCKTNVSSLETAYYITNMAIESAITNNEIFEAIRAHWTIETNNYIRDVTFKEDNLRTKFTTIARNTATCRTAVLNILYKEKLKNIRAKIEELSDDFQKVVKFLIDAKFL
jgi:predicted transposase YbfD/YdcC